TGRRTNRPVRLIGLPLLGSSAARLLGSLAALALAALAGATPTLPLPPAFTATASDKSTGVTGAANTYRGIRREARLAFDHHTITVANATRDNRQTACRPLDDDRPLPRRVGAVDDVHVRAALARDDRLRGHDQRAVLIE